MKRWLRDKVGRDCADVNEMENSFFFIHLHLCLSVITKEQKKQQHNGAAKYNNNNFCAK